MTTSTSRFAASCLSFSVFLLSAPAGAEPSAAPPETSPPPSGVEVAPAVPAPEAAPPVPPPPKPPYSLPWQLRPAVAASVVRSDTAFAFRKVNGESASTVVSTLLASYKVTPALAPMVRLGIAHDSPPVGDGASAFLNPVLGATFALSPAPGFKFAAFIGVTLPVGSGGGNSPDRAVRNALVAGALARSAMDNAMFAVNYLTIFPGVDFAYVSGGLTVQAEVTLFQLIRAKGDNVDPDASRTNMTSGLHVGYFVIPMLSLGADLRYQAWLANPTIADGDPRRDNATFAVGPRLHVKIGETSWFRPGIAYARGLDKPLTDVSQNIVQLDLPLSF